MGQRANLVLVDASKRQLFYSHWCANTLPRDLFWGPDHALAFIRIQRPVGGSGWLDDVWAEGAAVLDLDRKCLVLYGGEDILYDVPLRRTYLALLVQVWTGWAVRWAHEGIADLADYVGYPRDLVLNKSEQDSTAVSMMRSEEKGWTDLVATASFDGGTVRVYPLAGGVASYLLRGSTLADNLCMDDGLPRLLLDESTTQFPTGGFHLDLAAHRLDFWLARDAPDIANRVARAWPEWQTHWHHDRYEVQLQRAGGLLRFPSQDPRVLLGHCRDILLAEPGASPLSSINMLAKHEREQGKDVQLNPWALRDDRLELSLEHRIAVLDDAISRIVIC